MSWQHPLGTNLSIQEEGLGDIGVPPQQGTFWDVNPPTRGFGGTIAVTVPAVAVGIVAGVVDPVDSGPNAVEPAGDIVYFLLVKDLDG